ncbi:N-acetylglucosaminyldiphosphodolichol N-acetylglucosaminyltransferase [Lamellibrachia satsuma]|nr:N-acetylglucosaminyldiphosphodolichol N-acetylglucosaminyltransferase [Lamellibrachia satsuma]
MADDKKMSVFVTVGTTSFDQLIQTVSNDTVLQVLQKLGYCHMVLQIGRGSYEPTPQNTDSFKLEYFKFKDSIAEDIRCADLIISHAGAGSCLEVLGANKPLVVVINEELMNNHQVELADQLSSDGHLFYCTCSELPQLLESVELSHLKPFEAGKPEKFGTFLDKIMGVS